MRADRLLSLVLLLRNRGRMSASALARELEVSTRTVLRDVEALSAAGIPVYAERGRDGGFALLPGFTTDLTGLTVEEAKALLAAGAAATPAALGMAPAFASAMRKVLAAMPDAHRTAATRVAERVLVRQGGWFTDPRHEEHLGLIQQVVFAGRRLRLRYAARDGESRWRTVDPIGLVNAGGRWYLVATHRGSERTYRLSRVQDVQELDEQARRDPVVDLAGIWDRRRSEFRALHETVAATVRVRAERREDLLGSVLSAASETRADGWVTVEVEFGDAAHAGSVLWMLGDDAELLGPETLREGIRLRASGMADRHRARQAPESG
ncbi:helix-turn-helix transcriptional regulator [Prescottella agglutinans]|uniref:DNA-binding transcriptional regulator YafY n=1 Tax=Prescottella agglutinans TaxID=1644129 RepID=A0ABT6MH68_9NOCA|nr:WYL domain-containing protein [Prescottella agglutinans]MDH6283665.1 putative DNA-binding transcriptional regulator YafY [Prescottella agglutinans]